MSSNLFFFILKGVHEFLLSKIIPIILLLFFEVKESYLVLPLFSISLDFFVDF